ncbi:MAG: hypothetical protein NVSMB70_00610 [Chamaesiphon sp.]
MNLHWLGRLGEWNPQLFRELKGHLKPRNLTITVAISLLGQLLLLMTFASQLPVDGAKDVVHNRYCTGGVDSYIGTICLRDSLGAFAINWHLWSLDVFMWLSTIGIFAMLVVGTYMLISDLSREAHRGTLNFIRLSPQSSQSILTGKLLGVPILLYVTAALALPLHLGLGLAAQIPLSLILSFYGVLIASCFFFYSASLLYSLVSAGLGGFQSWLGSASVLMFLFLITSVISSNRITHTSVDWLMLFSPSFLLPYLVDSSSLSSNVVNYFNVHDLLQLQFFYLPLGTNAANASSFMLLNYGLWSYWAWQVLNRCFHNPSVIILDKRQSYLLTAGFEVVILGFSLQPATWRDSQTGLFDNFIYLLVFNLLLFMLLIAAVSPHRQALQDWARYRHQQGSARPRSLVKDLVWGEKSPASVAIALNLAIAAVILTPWVLMWPGSYDKAPALLGLLLSVNLILIYACVAQLMLFMKTPKRVLWASSTVGGLIILPPAIFSLLSIQPDKIPALWLFSAFFAWAAVKNAATTTVFLAILSQWLTLTFLGIQLSRQLRQAGESATKALLAGRPHLPTRMG